MNTFKEQVDLSAWNYAPEYRVRFMEERARIRQSLNLSNFDRPELVWSRKAFIEGFLFFYDTSIYNPRTENYEIDRFLDDGEREFGGYDVLLLWQPYPRIGIDQRNQFDFWRDMPGGLPALRKLVDRAHRRDVRCLVNYIPWDQCTRREPVSEAEAIARIVREIDADGVYGDTMYGMGCEFFEALEAIRPGLILESEAFANLGQLEWQTDMWGQMTKPAPLRPLVQQWVEPRCMIRTVERTSKDRTYLIALSLFFGMGFVVWENVFGWWNPFTARDRAMLQRAIPLLREHHDAFIDPNWRPLDYSPAPGVFGNRWEAGDKTVITLLNTTEQMFFALPLQLAHRQDMRYYDVWNGIELQPDYIETTNAVELRLTIEGKSCACIVALPDHAPRPTYAPKRTAYDPRSFYPTTFNPETEGYRGRRIAAPPASHDVQVVYDTDYRTLITAAACDPKPVARTEPHREGDPPEGMVYLPAGRFVMCIEHAWKLDEGSCYGNPVEYGHQHPLQYAWLPALYIDRTEVTNGDYFQFLRSSGYTPHDLTNFLKHWEKLNPTDVKSWRPPQGKGNHPVVWVALEDARAYATWAGKRLPTEAEWQYAAQGSDGRPWPWGDTFDPKKCNHDSPDTTPVDAFPEGASPFGCLDMAGNVWEWTESERDNGHIRYALLRSGSHFVTQGKYGGVFWYTAAGAQPCTGHQKILLLGPSLDRCQTLGFRCVKDT